MSILYNSQDNQEYIVVSVPDVPLLSTLGVFEGAKITKQATYKGGGPAVILVESREIALGKDLAVLIEVEKFV